MKKLTLLLAILGLGAGCSALAQTPGQVTQGPGNTAGILWASNFGQWAVPQGNTGQFSWSVPSQCNATASGIPLNPVFKVGTPITIKDQVPANTEIVTPSAVYISGSGCSITVSPVNKHNTFALISATAGLQEAINYASGLNYQVILTPDWSRLGGTTGMITAATGSAAVSIEDARSPCLVAYLWSGSAYVPQPNSCGGGGGGGGTTTFALTLNNSGSGAASPKTFNGSAAITASYNTVGAEQNLPGVTPDGSNGVTITGNMAAATTNGAYTVASGANLVTVLAAASANSEYDLTPGVTYTISGTLNITANNVILNFRGAQVTCPSSGDCIYWTGLNGKLIDSFLVPSGNSTGASIHNGTIATGNLIIDHPQWLASGGNTWYYGIQIDADQHAVINNMIGPSQVLANTASFVGSAIYNANGTPSSAHAAVLYLNNSTLSMGCYGNGIDWQFGNDVHLSSVEIQAYQQFGVRFWNQGIGANGTIVADKVHNEAGNCTNPQMNGIISSAGYILEDGYLINNGGGLGGNMPSFPVSGTAGTTVYAWWVRVHGGTSGNPYTNLMPIGYVANGNATLSGSNYVTVTWPSLPITTGSISCDLFRTQGTGSAATPAPHGAASATEVASGIACDTATVGQTYVSYVDNVPAASLTAVNLDQLGTFYPELPIWPGGVVLATSIPNGNGTPSSVAKFSGTCPAGYTFVSPMAGYGYEASYNPVVCEGPTLDSYTTDKLPTSNVMVSRTNGSAPGLGGSAWMLPGSQYYGTSSNNAKGLLNFGVPGGVNGGSGLNRGPYDLLTAVDSSPAKTQAYPNQRPVADAGDSAIGIDQSTN